jgi:5S rRNA maturation endonuclease (ribonuclease M5)
VLQLCSVAAASFAVRNSRLAAFDGEYVCIVIIFADADSQDGKLRAKLIRDVSAH